MERKGTIPRNSRRTVETLPSFMVMMFSSSSSANGTTSCWARGLSLFMASTQGWSESKVSERSSRGTLFRNWSLVMMMSMWSRMNSSSSSLYLYCRQLMRGIGYLRTNWSNTGWSSTCSYTPKPT